MLLRLLAGTKEGKQRGESAQGGVDEAKDRKLATYYRYETETFLYAGTAAPPEGSVS